MSSNAELSRPAADAPQPNNATPGLERRVMRDDVMSEETEDRKVWKWEVWPNPYTSDFDCYVTDDDDDAREAILHAAEMHLWDQNDGEERTLRVLHNAQVKPASCRTGKEP